MIKIIFVCLGNICRSPMAEAIFKKMVADCGLTLSFDITSRATSCCEVGNPIYPPARRVLEQKGYDFAHTAQQITLQDVKNADYIFVMDDTNLHDLVRLTGGNYGEKIAKLGHFLPQRMDIDDPWYTRDFERTYNEIYTSCQAMLSHLQEKHAKALDYDRRH